MAFLRADGSYYQGDRAHPLDVEVPQRPSPLHTWDGAAWVIDATVEHNTPIKKRIEAIEDQYPFKHRTFREGHYGTALLTDLVNARLLALEQQINARLAAIAAAAGVTTPEPVALPKGADGRTLPDVKTNKGMVDIKTADDLVKAERSQLWPE